MHEEPEPTDAQCVVDAVERAALVFYVDGSWSPFSGSVPESRVTRPDEATTVQFNSMPGRRPHAEYRGPLGRWWVPIDPSSGFPDDEPTFVRDVDSSSRLVN
jgi:hypothetical protein